MDTQYYIGDSKSEKIKEDRNQVKLHEFIKNPKTVLTIEEYKEISTAALNKINEPKSYCTRFKNYIKSLLFPNLNLINSRSTTGSYKKIHTLLSAVETIEKLKRDKILLIINLRQGGFVIDEWNAETEITKYGKFLKESLESVRKKENYKLDIHIGNVLTLNALLTILENPANDFQLDKLIFIHTPKVIPQDGKIYSDRKFLKIANLKSEDIVNRNIELILFNNDNSAGKEYKDNFNFEID